VNLGAEWIEAVPAGERAYAARLAAATRRALSAGRVDTDALARDGLGTPHSVLILEGFVVRDLVLGAVASASLHGPGDILRPWSGGERPLSGVSHWTVATGGATVAVIDARLQRAAARWPGIGQLLRERLGEQLDAAALRRAILTLPRADQRVLALLWQLADRWGTVTPNGVFVRLDLTHALIGRLVGARRPTISLAVHALGQAGLVTRTPEHHWCLALGSDAAIGAGALGAPVTA
jgi:CRP-like cAMP-binding protein